MIGVLCRTRAGLSVCLAQGEGILVQYTEVLEKLKSLCDPQGIAAMTGYGINADNAFGIPIPRLRKLSM